MTTLGHVISTLIDTSLGIKQNLIVPYQESVLTKLLQNSFGGNSKTTVIATLAPTDINYNDTLNTLYFADYVRRIKNCVTINEHSIEKLMRQLNV